MGALGREGTSPRCWCPRGLHRQAQWKSLAFPFPCLPLACSPPPLSQGLCFPSLHPSPAPRWPRRAVRAACVVPGPETVLGEACVVLDLQAVLSEAAQRRLRVGGLDPSRSS